MHESDPDFAVLHALSLRGMVARESLETVVGADVVAERVPILVDAGLIRELTGRMSGFTLTKDGRAKHAEQLPADRAAGRLADVLKAPYEQFLAVNQPFVDLCSAWQVRRDDNEPNDHTDATYDEGILFELEEIHRTGAQVAASVGEVGDRFTSYGPRLDTAIGKVRAGEHEWFTKPTIDSYHTVWFELHEDLLVSQGIEREEGR